MKRLLIFILTLTAVLQLWATPDLKSTKRYHIVCSMFTQGCVTDGATAGQTTPVYYLTTATNSEDTWWIFTEEATGLFSIKNAKTGYYITYDGVRSDTPSLRRYISMTKDKDGNNSLWSINQQSTGVYTIRNVQQQNNIWDVRVDSYCVGTYSNNGSGNQNQCFSFYDEQGTQVQERAEQPIGGTGIDVSSWFVASIAQPTEWTFEGGTWSDPGFGNYVNGQVSVVTPFLERWNDTTYGPLSNGALYQTLSNLPPGDYTLQADIIAVRQRGNGWYQQPEETGYGVFLFANNQTTEAGTRNERPERYTVEVTIGQEGKLQAGIRISDTNANWVATDNFVLFFNGTEEELIEGEKVKVRAELSNYYSAAEIDALISNAGDNFAMLEQLRKSVAYMPAKDPLSLLAGNITINGKGIAYVESTNLYLCSIPLEEFDNGYEATIDYDADSNGATLLINNARITPGSNYRFNTISEGQNYTLSVKTSDGKSVSKALTFTSLPIVKIYGSFSNNYSNGYIIVHEPTKTMPELLHMKAKWRGGITNSNGKNKRNYHVKLLDENGEKLEQKFFGLRNDNSWILEACQVDMSRIRNRVLTDLWNDYSTPPYYIQDEPKALTGSRGKFVELILNDEYRGIYCMTENMDRKQMKLKKYDEETGTIHGQLWKSKDWSYATFMGTKPDGGYTPKDYLSNPNNSSEMWDSYQVKYPELEDVSPTDWSVLYNAVNFVCTSSDDLFSHYISDYFDLPLVIDYYILMETVLATDNHGKNMFFACYDKTKSKKITFGVWDMDATCGQRWSDDYFHSNLMRPDQDYSEYIARNEHGDYNLFKRLRNTNAYNFNEKVRLRYNELRQNHLATDNILNYFHTYLDEFKKCGADKREYARWNGDTDISRLNLDFDNEMNYLTDWFTRRMDYLDTTRFEISSLPPISGIEDFSGSQTPDAQSVYDMKGCYVSQMSNFDHLPSGIYIVNGKKIVKK